jgi:hypothetical protein
MATCARGTRRGEATVDRVTQWPVILVGVGGSGASLAAYAWAPKVACLRS